MFSVHASVRLVATAVSTKMSAVLLRSKLVNEKRQQKIDLQEETCGE